MAKVAKTSPDYNDPRPSRSAYTHARSELKLARHYRELAALKEEGTEQKENCLREAARCEKCAERWMESKHGKGANIPLIDGRLPPRNSK